MEDSVIVDLYLSRNQSAIYHTSQKYGFRLRLIAKRIVEDLESAEECENDTYYEAWNLIPPNEPRTYLFAFLGKITRHLAIDVCRRRNAVKRQAQYCELTKEMEECLPGSGNVDETIDAGILAGHLNTFLNGCTEEQRNIFIRRYWFFDTIPEICKRYGYSQSKVKSVLFRIRKDLKKYLEKEGYMI